MFSTDEKKLLDREARDVRRQVAMEAAALSFGQPGAPSDAVLIARAQACYDWLSRGEEPAPVSAIAGGRAS